MEITRAGSRESWLAVVRSELVMNTIHAVHSEVELELVTMKTTDDKILNRTLDKVGGEDLSIEELDAALLDGRVDLTTHSCEDLSMEKDLRIPLTGFSCREDPQGALVLPQRVEGLDPSRPIDCVSVRRMVRLRALSPGVTVTPVWGNVLAHLCKLDEGQFSALVLAAAELKRLGLEEYVTRYFTVEELLPATGRGILALQTWAGGELPYLDGILDADGTDRARAERTFVRALGGGCSAPIAAHARLGDNTVTIDGLYVADTGEVRRERLSGPRVQGEAPGEALVRRLKEGGACLEKRY